MGGGFSGSAKRSSLACVAWNCQGIGSTPTVRRLKGLQKCFSPDIVFLMETKQQDEAIFKHFKRTAYVNHFTVPPVGLSGGLSLSWKDDVEVEILDSSPNLIDTQIKSKQNSFFVTFVYGAPRQEERDAFWERLMILSAQWDEAWLLTSDFNDLLDNSEKEGGPLRWEGSFLSFRNFVSQAGLWDVQHTGNTLSWRGVRYSHFIQSRLDRAMANCAWSEIFPSGYCQYLRFEGSDHRPLITFFDQDEAKKKGVFRFDRRLQDNPEIHKIVDLSWDKKIQESIISKTSKVRAKIVEWSKEQSLNSKTRIVSAQTALEAALSSSIPDDAIIATITHELNKA